nr:PEP-CTERM sorting domain-containing protein [uncultured Desulfobacter sp.]
MKKFFRILIPIVLLAFSFLPVAYSAPKIDGVMSYTDDDDWRVGGGQSVSIVNGAFSADTTLANVVVEENYALYNSYTNNKYYDVEELGVYIADNKLYIGLQTQFDLSYSPNGAGISAGDFIFTFGSSDDTTFSDYNDGDYAFSFDFSVDSDNKVDITFLSDIKTVSYPDSDNYGTAWEIESAGTEVHGTASDNENEDGVSASDSEISYTYAYSENNADSTDWYPDGQYTLELAINLDSLSDELSSLLNSAGDHDSVAMYWQPSCGNDFLAAKTAFNYVPKSSSANVSPTPEPATMLLFGMGLLGASLFGRRRKRTEKSD